MNGRGQPCLRGRGGRRERRRHTQKGGLSALQRKGGLNLQCAHCAGSRERAGADRGRNGSISQPHGSSASTERQCGRRQDHKGLVHLEGYRASGVPGMVVQGEWGTEKRKELGAKERAWRVG